MQDKYVKLEEIKARIKQKSGRAKDYSEESRKMPFGVLNDYFKELIRELPDGQEKIKDTVHRAQFVQGLMEIREEITGKNQESPKPPQE